MYSNRFNSIDEFMHAAQCSCPMCSAKMKQTGEHEAPGQPIDIDMSWNKTKVGGDGKKY